MRRPAVFIDRDGTVNEQMGYINHISRFVLLPGSAEAIKLLNTHGFRAFVTSNQSGVARGYFPPELVDRVHARMRELLEREGGQVDEVYYCPHHPDGVVPEYSRRCPCRKPAAGMIEEACRDFDIDLGHSYVIGDRLIDIEMAERASLKGILVKTGYGRGEVDYLLPHASLKPVYIARDLLEAVQWIVERNAQGDPQ